MDSPSFTLPEMEDNYTVSYNQDEGGMEVLYDITNIFLNAVIGGNFFPDGFLSEEKFPDLESVESNFLDEVVGNAQAIVQANIPILVCIVLGLLLALVSFIYGIVFCCCCKAKNKTAEDNGLKKLLLSILLFILLVVTSLGCMWFFLGAKTAQKGLNKIPEDVIDILHDGDLYMNITIDELQYLLQNNFDEVIVNFNTAIDQVDQNFRDFTENLKNKIKLDEIISEASSFIVLLTEYEDIIGPLWKAVIDSSSDISTSFQAIDDAAIFCHPVKPGLDDLCAKITLASTIFGNSFPSNLPAALPELPSGALSQLQSLQDTLNSIEQSIDDISTDAIDKYFPNIIEEIGDIKTFLKDALDEITEPIEDIQAEIFRNGNIATQLENVRDAYFPYFNISLLVLGSFLAVILALFMIGMCLGSCSKEGSGIAITGSRIMFIANSVFFLLAILLFILCTAFFTVGALGEKALCKTMDNPGDSEIIAFVNPLLSSTMTNIFNGIADEDIEVEFDLAQIISDIHNNTAIYPLLQLHYIFDIEKLTDWRNTYGITPIIDTANETITNIIKDLVNMDDFDKDGILDIAHKIDDLSSQLSPLLDDTLPTVLDEASKQLNKIKEEIEGIIAGLPTTSLPAGLPEIMEHFNEIITEFETLRTAVTKLQESLIELLSFFGNGSTEFDMAGKVAAIFTLVENAFSYLENGAIMDFFEESVTILTKVVDDYVALAIDRAENHIGDTGPLSNIYNATYTDICIEIIAPLNSVWSGLGWCLLMILIPVTLLVTSLRKIYSSSPPAPSMRPQDTNGYKSSRNPAARAVSYEEVPMPSYNERNTRINAYESRASSYMNSHQPSAPPPYQSNDMRGRYQQPVKR